MTHPSWRRGAGLGLAASVGLGFAVVVGSMLAPADGPTRVIPDGTVSAPAPLVDAGPEAALRMVDRLQLFRTGNLGTRMSLRSPEVTALLRHVAAGLLPEGVDDPQVHLVGSEVRLRASVAPAALPGGTHLDIASAALPERVDVELRGRLLHHGAGRVAYRIDRAEVEGVPLPASVVARLVDGWPGGFVEGTEDPPGALVVVRWPLRATRLRVADDVLWLERDEPIVLESVDGSDGG